MKKLLEDNGYVFEPHAQIWMNPDYAGIPYNDGDEVENRIALAVKETKDLSVLSTEIRQYCIDWPSLYHLTGTRANIMRPFEAIYKNASVLEIGAGCGAITRYLGESGANVLALEGSPRRASIARSRTRDLTNVTVVSEKFDQFKCTEKFDIVTLIGVLEYANLFTPGDNPPLAMLTRVKQLLKPQGKLIIAIENQLGLKYFAGAPEDHLGEPMIGIEGRYRQDQPQTFGRKVLTSMLTTVGLSTSEFLAPFPDYKLPISIVTENGFNNDKFDASALAWQAVKRDPQLPVHANFSLELTWPQVFKNSLGLDLSNSFLVIASEGISATILSDTLAFHYSTERSAHYAKKTLFKTDASGTIKTHYQRLTPQSTTLQPLLPIPKLFLDFFETDDYKLGKTLSQTFIQIVTQDAWEIEHVRDFARTYLSTLNSILDQEQSSIDISSMSSLVPGRFFDAIPQNIIIGTDSKFTLIDKEWVYHQPVELGYLLFRGLLWSINSVTRFGKPNFSGEIRNFALLQNIFSGLDWTLKTTDYQRYAALEASIQTQVGGRSVGDFYSVWAEAVLPFCSLNDFSKQQTLALAIRTQELAQRTQELERRTEELAHRTQEVAEQGNESHSRGLKIVDLNAQLHVLNLRIQALEASFSWRLTRPVRFSSRQLRRIPLVFRVLNPVLKYASGYRGATAALVTALRNDGVKGVRRYVRDAVAAFNFVPSSEPAFFKVPDLKPFVAKQECLVQYQSAVKVICFYLPQYHTIPENNAWWGEGFTEWTNVKPTLPQYVGHYQPHKPEALGYYDLLDSSTQRKQIALAKQYGIGGFCFYFYWFAGKLLLEKPTENYLNDKSLDFPFCLCWANENWSRRWDGLDHEVLIAQQHSPDDDIAFISHIAKYLRDARYITVDGKPLILVYRPQLLPEAKATAGRWREWCRINGVGEIYLAYTQSFETIDPANYGFDAAIEFPPNNSSPPNLTESTPDKNPDFSGNIYDWRIFLDRSKRYLQPPYTLHRSVCPAWDNTARRKNKGSIFVNSTPALFQKWVENAIRYTVDHFHKPSERLLFVNAWNEWAEGAHLEPDQKFGYANLCAIRNAQIVHHYKTKDSNPTSKHQVALVIHAYYVDVFEEVLQHIDIDTLQLFNKIYITCHAKNELNVQALLDKYKITAVLHIAPNKGRDILPFLKILPVVMNDGADIVVKLHTKKSTHRSDGDEWRKELIGALLNFDVLNAAFQKMQAEPTLGVLGPVGNVVPMSTYWGSNQEAVLKLTQRLGVDLESIRHQSFVAGSMFIAKVTALLPLVGLELQDDEFETEDGQVDGTMAHAIERAISISAGSLGYKVQSIDGQLTTEFAYAKRT